MRVAAAVHHAARQRGFTLVELVTTLVLVGAVAAIAAPRFADPGPFRERGFFDEAIATTRYAHQVAQASGCTVRVAFSAGYSAFIACDGGAESALTRPGAADAISATAPSGVSVTTTSFTFDKIGRATIGAGGATVTIGSYAFTVDAETGLLQ